MPTGGFLPPEGRGGPGEVEDHEVTIGFVEHDQIGIGNYFSVGIDIVDRAMPKQIDATSNGTIHRRPAPCFIYLHSSLNSPSSGRPHSIAAHRKHNAEHFRVTAQRAFRARRPSLQHGA